MPKSLKYIFALVCYLQGLNASGADAVLNCPLTLGAFLQKLFSRPIPEALHYRLNSGPLAWNLGKHVTRKDIEKVAMPIAETVLRQARRSKTMGGTPTSEVERILKSAGVSLAALEQTGIDEALENLKREIREVPIGDKNLVLPLERRRIRLAEFDYIRSLKIKKDLDLRQLSDGSFLIYLTDTSSGLVSLEDKIFGFNRSWFKRSVWLNKAPNFHYPGIYQVETQEPHALILNRFIEELELILKPFGLKDDSQNWRQQFFTYLNSYYRPLVNWEIQELDRNEQNLIDMSALMSWLGSREVLVDHELLSEFLRTESGIHKSRASAIAAKMSRELPPSISANFSVELFSGSVRLNIYIKTNDISPELIGRLQAKDSGALWNAKISFRIEPNIDLPGDLMPAPKQIENLVMTLVKRFNLHQKRDDLPLSAKKIEL